MKLINDNACVWLNELTKKLNIKILNKDLVSGYLLIGAGYFRLSIARKFSEIDKKILVSRKITLINLN